MPRLEYFSAKNLAEHPVSDSCLVSDDYYINLHLQENDDDQMSTEEADHPATGTGDREPPLPLRLDPRDRITHLQISKRQKVLLWTSGGISIIVAILLLLSGIMDLTTPDSHPGNRFSMLILIVSGVAAIKVASTRIGNTCLLAFSMLSASSCFCECLVQLLNYHYLPNGVEFRIVDNGTLSLSILGAAVSVMQVCIGLCISSSTARLESNSQWHKKQYLIFGLGLALVTAGMATSGVTLAMYSHVQSDVVTNSTLGITLLIEDVKWTMSTDLISHGWLIAASGVSLALSAVHATKCRLLASIALIGGTLFATARNLLHPLTEFYVTAWSTVRDINLSAALLLTYLLVLGLSIVALILVVRRIDHETVCQMALRHYVEKQGWQLYKRTAFIQLSLALLYATVWLTCFGEHYLYLLDFTPLPLLMLLHSLLAYAVASTYSYLLLLLNTVWAFSCGLYATRDLYLFDYHMDISDYDPVDHTQSSDNSTSITLYLPTIPKGGLHLLLTAVALMETVLSAALMLMYIKTLADTVIFGASEPLRLRRSKVCIGALGIVQLISGVLLLTFGFVLFLSHHFIVEYVGDTCTLLGALIVATGLASVLASCSKTSTAAMPVSIVLNCLAFMAIWQHTDGEGLLLSRIFTYDHEHPNTNYHRSYIFSQASFVLLPLCQVTSGLSLIGLEHLLTEGALDFGPRSVDPVIGGYQLVESRLAAA